MTKHEWDVLNKMVGIELKHPEHGLIVTNLTNTLEIGFDALYL